MKIFYSQSSSGLPTAATPPWFLFWSAVRQGCPSSFPSSLSSSSSRSLFISSDSDDFWEHSGNPLDPNRGEGGQFDPSDVFSVHRKTEED